jgi:phosphoribosyl 1,2-cyclic phosphate phosphodiesterase
MHYGYKKHISHFTLPEAMEVADELKIPQVYFTHISHQLGRHKDVNETLTPHRLLAYDMQEIHL